jgi:acetyl esterase
MTVKNYQTPISKEKSMKRGIANPLVKVLIITLMGSTIFAVETTPDVKTFTYKTIGDRELKIYVHYPAGWKAGDSRPGIIFFFGGGWIGGRIEQFQPQAEYLAGRGMVAARADYRVKSRDGVTPDKCVEDARSAVRWMRKNAGKLGIDPKKLITSGGSAGGHLAACMMIPKSVEADGDDLSISTIPQAMVLFNPVLSFENEQMLKRINGDEQLARKISPTRYLDKNSPPALILFGTKDRLKIFGDEYWKKAEALGVRAEKYLAEGQGHGFFNRSPWMERTLLAVDRFLASLGYLKGEPTIKVPEQTAVERGA